MLHHRPREFGHATSLWRLQRAAEVSCAQGLRATQVSGEPIRLPRKRLGIGWKRAKQGMTSPDPEYIRQKGAATA